MSHLRQVAAVAQTGALFVTLGMCAALPGAERDADVIVVGAGISGLSAALEAARGGATVAVVEMSSVFGGHAVVSGGNVCIVATPLQESGRIKDSPDIAYKDLTEWGEDADPRWARYYAENSRKEIYDWLQPMGVTFHAVIPHDGNSVPRLHMARGRGLGLVSPLYRECLRHPNITFIWNTRVIRLLRGQHPEGGRIVGVTAEDLRQRRRRTLRGAAVILAAGGFQSNLDMVREFWPRSLPMPKRLLAGAGQNAVGAVHAVAQKAGAALHNLDHQWNYAIGLPDPRDPSGRRGLASFNPAGIWVNAEGKRFVNEFAGAKTSLPALLAQKDATFWAIFDEAGKTSFGVTMAGWNDFRQIERLILNNPRLVKSAATLDQLAGQVGMQPAALTETVARYNRMVAEGRDLDFGRFHPGGVLKPATIEKPPFYAAQFYPITRKSMGGIKVDLSCRVLDRAGQPIPGLYAVGELAGFAGVNGKAALEGTFLGPSIVTGRVAARAVVAEVKEPGLVRPAPTAPARININNNSASNAASCAGCHKLEVQVSRSRPGFWHFEKSHRVVLERRLECGSCHAGMEPFRREAHRIDRAAQIENCAFCHGGR